MNGKVLVLLVIGVLGEGVHVVGHSVPVSWSGDVVVAGHTTEGLPPTDETHREYPVFVGLRLPGAIMQTTSSAPH
jgi:hypothetical protein